MSTSLHPMLNIAIKAARAAGSVINRGSLDLDLLTVTHKGPNDYVSEVDRAAEEAVIETLLQAYPGHGILAEESGRSRGARDSEFTWIIDPLDGTTNFLHGLPIYAVSIALVHRGVLQQAVVYDPSRNDLFYASRGRGAFLNDKRLRVSKRTRLAEGLIGTGFPFRKGDNLQRYLKMFEAVMSASAGLRRTGSAALDLCYVAAGWYDGFFETGLSPWDVAAGALIITEAGGLCGNFTGEADFLYQRELVVGSPKVYGQLVALLAPFSHVIKTEPAADPDADADTDTGHDATAAAGGDPAAQPDDSAADGTQRGPGAEGDTPLAALGRATTAAAPRRKLSAKAPASQAQADTGTDTTPTIGLPGAAPDAPLFESAAVQPRDRTPVRVRKAELPPSAQAEADGAGSVGTGRSGSGERNKPPMREAHPGPAAARKTGGFKPSGDRPGSRPPAKRSFKPRER